MHWLIRHWSCTTAGALIASNDNWRLRSSAGLSPQPGPRHQDSGHAPSDGRESAIIADLPPGNYTAIVRGVNNTTGVALVEVYDLSADASSILGNISTRSFVQTDDNVMIGGFIVEGTQPKRVIIRAIGPELISLSAFPMHWLIRHWSCTTAQGALIASNDNWQHTIIGGIITRGQVHDIRTAATLQQTPVNRRSLQSCHRVTTPRSCAA